MHGPLRRIELGSIGCNRFVCQFWQKCQGFDSLELTDAMEHHREQKENPVGTKLILKAVNGDLVEDGTISELDLKLVGPVPSEHIFPF